MNFPLFIARRIIGGKQSAFSALIIKIAVIAVALSLAVMLLATALVAGFKREISNKVYGFNGHISITNFDRNRSYEDLIPIVQSEGLTKNLYNLEGVSHVQSFAHKVGVLKKDDDIEGIVLKRIGSDFDWSYFNKSLIAGNTFAVNDTARSPKMVVSQFTANRLQLEVGDELLAYFVKDRVRFRKFSVAGIYKTGLEEFDEKFALVDIGHIRHLNKWEDNQVGGLSVFLDDEQEAAAVNDEIYYTILDSETRSRTARSINPGIFDWLDLQNINERIILILMILVASINMITALLILILERTNMVGILKALGAQSSKIRLIFLYNAAYIIGFGLLLGNLLGLGLAAIQHFFGVVTLPEESYYLTVAPVEFNWGLILLLNMGTFAICLFALIVPSFLVSWIQPIKAIRFD